MPNQPSTDPGNGPLEFNTITMLTFPDESGQLRGIPMIRYALNPQQDIILLGSSAEPVEFDGHGVATWSCLGKLSDQPLMMYQITLNSLEHDGWNLNEYPDPYVLLGTMNDETAPGATFLMERSEMAPKSPLEGHLLKVARAWVNGKAEQPLLTIQDFYERLRKEKELFLADRSRVLTTSALVVLAGNAVQIRAGRPREGVLATIRLAS